MLSHQRERVGWVEHTHQLHFIEVMGFAKLNPSYVLSLKERFMTRKLPKRGLPPMHPGELLREEILPALDRSKTEIAKLLGVSRQTLYDVLKEKQPVTPGMALRLGKLCGNGPDLWLNLQKRYDLHQAQQELGEKIRKIPTLEVA
jgi:addiction module HigA family antidote